MPNKKRMIKGTKNINFLFKIKFELDNVNKFLIFDEKYIKETGNIIVT